MRIGPMGYIVPLYDPLRLRGRTRRCWTTCSHGRLELGLVSGISPDYFQHYQGDFPNRRRACHEALAL